MGLAVDAHAGILFWSDIDPGNRGIYRATLQGEDQTRILSGTELMFSGSRGVHTRCE